MKHVLTTSLFLFSILCCQAQIEGGLLFGLTQATTAEMNAIANISQGQMLYNTDLKKVVVFDGSDWAPTSNTSWDLAGNSGDSATFLGTTNDIPLKLGSNGKDLLQSGRRQSMGLTQSYPDYDDANQYLTYIKGDNGVSALQFQADAANFYKPMFFTTATGNFRLKGSAAGTDFFEIGSAGTNNAGEMEFIIGDDGAEPFLFQRYDYRDGLKKELLRIQGSGNSQVAKPRIGINTGQMANSTLQISGSFSAGIIETNANITLDESHHTVIVNSNSAVSLPSANSCQGRIYILSRTKATMPLP
ncbi:MAG: hypothetical protein AAGA86_14330 [Bacteroidota bacterium]